ncbi:hypothetical protein SPHINGO8AM_40131 [Sphingomonas sp. 8AM]|nr:hypothetical protein SPHINGO8AM_40131 [Sphingomonas sp. 8AM]
MTTTDPPEFGDHANADQFGERIADDLRDKQHRLIVDGMVPAGHHGEGRRGKRLAKGVHREIGAERRTSINERVEGRLYTGGAATTLCDQKLRVHTSGMVQKNYSAVTSPAGKPCSRFGVLERRVTGSASQPPFVRLPQGGGFQSRQLFRKTDAAVLRACGMERVGTLIMIPASSARIRRRLAPDGRR